MPTENESNTLYAGKHVSMVERGGWEYVTRNLTQPAVGIVAITKTDNVVLVEQYRPPVEASVIELPAGLVGDIAGSEDEAMIEAAKRELLEETGYSAQRWTRLGSGYTSPGLTDEAIEFFLAEDLEKQQAGGGDEGENITVHEIALSQVIQWLSRLNRPADLKLLAGLSMAIPHLERNIGIK